MIRIFSVFLAFIICDIWGTNIKGSIRKSPTISIAKIVELYSASENNYSHTEEVKLNSLELEGDNNRKEQMFLEKEYDIDGLFSTLFTLFESAGKGPQYLISTDEEKIIKSIEVERDCIKNSYRSSISLDYNKDNILSLYFHIFKNNGSHCDIVAQVAPRSSWRFLKMLGNSYAIDFTSPNYEQYLTKTLNELTVQMKKMETMRTCKVVSVNNSAKVIAQDTQNAKNTEKQKNSSCSFLLSNNQSLKDQTVIEHIESLIPIVTEKFYNAFVYFRPYNSYYFENFKNKRKASLVCSISYAERDKKRQVIIHSDCSFSLGRLKESDNYIYNIAYIALYKDSAYEFNQTLLIELLNILLEQKRLHKFKRVIDTDSVDF